LKNKRDLRTIKLCQYTSIAASFSFTSNDDASTSTKGTTSTQS